MAGHHRRGSVTPAQIKRARERLGLSQLGMAKALGLSRQQTISDWENEKKAPPPFLELAIKQLLNTKPENGKSKR